MSRLATWLSARTPAPPRSLAARLGRVGGDATGAVSAALGDEAMLALDRARRAPGRVRESAFHLLEADALLTYACEAALQDADAEGTLSRLLRQAGSARTP